MNDEQPRKEELKEGEDFYIDPVRGLLTFTAAYLKKRGYCCECGCKHCPYRLTS